MLAKKNSYMCWKYFFYNVRSSIEPFEASHPHKKQYLLIRFWRKKLTPLGYGILLTIVRLWKLMFADDKNFILILLSKIKSAAFQKLQNSIIWIVWLVVKIVFALILNSINTYVVRTYFKLRYVTLRYVNILRFRYLALII